MDIDIRKTATDAAYITVGVGVLGYQQAQVRRRELTKALGSSVDEVRSRIEPLVEPLVEHVQSLPDQVREVADAGRERIADLVDGVRGA